MPTRAPQPPGSRTAPRVVIAGCGVAGFEAALALRERAGSRVGVELLGPDASFRYRPLAVAEQFGLGEVETFDVSDLARRAGATFRKATLLAIDADRHEAITSDGVVRYDTLVVAVGSVPVEAIAGALTFGSRDAGRALRAMLDEIAAGRHRRLAVVVPGGSAWSLPAYELALMSARHLAGRGVGGSPVVLVTPEEAPLAMFGSEGSEAVADLLAECSVEIRLDAFATGFADGAVALTPDGGLDVDSVVALPRLEGQRLEGLPQTVEGFVPVDAQGRVAGMDDVFAAGDVTNFPVKQGGLAAQQADAVADAIAAAAGADVEPQPFRPVLRGLLLTGGESRFLRHEESGGADHAVVSPDPLWWPPAKIVGRYLASFLATAAGAKEKDEAPPPAGVLTIDVELDPAMTYGRRAPVADRTGDGVTVAEVMEAPLVVAPEDTLGEVAERMRADDSGAVTVAEFGRLIGILTARDLLHAIAARTHPSEARVRSWMTAEPVTASRSTSIEAAAALMVEYGVHHLPVVDGEAPVGMLAVEQVGRARHLGVGLGF